MPFGLSSSPFLLLSVLHHHFATLDEPLQKQLMDSTYVDDVVTSTPSDEERQTFKQQVQSSLASVSIPLRWTDPEKVLGVPWNQETDELSIKLKEVEQPQVSSQRELLRFSAAVYDPMGLISPFTIRLRMLLQECWKAGQEWDDPVPQVVEQQWREWMQEAQVAKINFPRWVQRTTSSCTYFAMRHKAHMPLLSTWSFPIVKLPICSYPRRGFPL